jgi:hypothetical protein
VRSIIAVDDWAVFSDGSCKESEEVGVVLLRKGAEEWVGSAAHDFKKAEPTAPRTSLLGVSSIGNGLSLCCVNIQLPTIDISDGGRVWRLKLEGIWWGGRGRGIEWER